MEPVLIYVVTGSFCEETWHDLVTLDPDAAFTEWSVPLKANDWRAVEVWQDGKVVREIGKSRTELEWSDPERGTTIHARLRYA